MAAFQSLSAYEEALRRNTDCVYFLASPLTCKNGNECEYRHSDIARVNPTECWFWLDGNCLNPRCGFRHPPLDGLLGAQVPRPIGPSVPVTQTLTASSTRAQNASTKQVVACKFFQKGQCLKGNRCPFLHEPKASLLSGTAFATEPAAIKEKVPSGLDKYMRTKKILPVNAAISVKGLPQPKRRFKIESSPALLRDEYAVNKMVPQTSGVTPYISSGIQESRSNHVQQSHLLDEPEAMNNKVTEGVSTVPSPGLDALIDGERRDSDYYPSGDRYGMSMEHEAGNEYDVDHSTDLNTITAVDDETFQDSLGYDAHNHRKGIQYGWEQHRVSSGRMSGGSYVERRPYDRSVNLGHLDKLDLRHRLAKHNKPNDFQGRITLPRRFSSPNSSLSAVRTSISSHHGTIWDHKNAEPTKQHATPHQSLGKRRELMTEGYQQNGNGFSFEGPNPLGEILKRKRGGTINDTYASRNQGNIDESHRENDATENEANSSALLQTTMVEVTLESVAINGQLNHEQVDGAVTDCW